MVKCETRVSEKGNVGYKVTHLDGRATCKLCDFLVTEEHKKNRISPDLLTLEGLGGFTLQRGFPQYL